MRNIEKKVLKYIHEKNLLPNDINTVYVATSGGADSMALLAFLRDHMNLNVVAVHVNHGIRGASADRDQAFVVNYCKNYNIQCIVFNAREDNIEIPEKASEEWARNLRYNYFNTLDMSNAVIATAHTASDQVETVVFRLARGCGINGLAGIPAKRDNIIRPFLCLTRKETEQLVSYYNTYHVTDESNLTDEYARNKIRHHVVPVMKEINQNTEAAVMKTCDRISRINDFMYQYALTALHKSGDVENHRYYTNIFANNNQAIIEQMLMIVLEKYEYADILIERICQTLKDVDYNAPEHALLKYQLSDYDTLIVTNQVITIQKKVESAELHEGRNEFGQWGHGIVVKQISREEYEAITLDKRQLAFVLNGDKFNLSDFTMYQKSDGDRFKPACRYQTKVSHHLNGLHMMEKENVPIVKDKDGNIVYLHNVGFTDNMLPDENTKTIYYFCSY